MLIGILIATLLNLASAADVETFTIIKVKPYERQQLKTYNIEFNSYTEKCGADVSLALLDLSGKILSLNCNYCENGVYLHRDVDINDGNADFFTLIPSNGKYGSTVAVLACLEKLKFIKDSVDSDQLSVEITVDRSSHGAWAGNVVSIEKGPKITEDIKFNFLKNKISEYQKEYPNIYFSPDYSIVQPALGAIKTTLDLLQDYRDNIKKDRSYSSRMRSYQQWYLYKHDNGKTTADFLVNLSASVGTQSLSCYDQEVASYSEAPVLPLLTNYKDQGTLIENKPILTEYADIGSLEKSTRLLTACAKIISDGEHVIDDVLVNLKRYIKEDKPSEIYISGINLSLQEKTSDLTVIDNMVRDISQVQLKNVFFSLLSNRYKFSIATLDPTNSSLIEKIIPFENNDIKKRINKDFSHSSISKALGDANEEYRKLATDKETKPLFEYSQNIKQDLSKSFNSEIKRMNAACGVANKLYSDLQAGTYNSDLEDIKKSVEEKFKTDLIPMSVVINDDGTWQSGQDYALNEQKKERGSWIEKVKNYIGEKRYNELYDEAFGFVKSVKKTKISAVNKEIYYFADSPENRLDQLLHDELEQRLLSASKESDKKRKPSKSQLRLPTDEEWEISELLNPGKSYLKFSLNENMVNKEIVQRLKKVTEELIQQSSYRLANTKFVHLLLVEDFRRTLGMSGNGDIVQERCFDGDGKLFNEATVLDVKKAIKGYEKLSLSSAKDMLDKIEHIKVMDNINHGDSYNYLKVDFIKDSLKTSPLVIADLLRLKHDYRYEELLCLYIKEINTAAENKILARKILFWSGMTASLAATVISGGSLGFTVPAMLATGISSAAMATDILFVASEGFEAWNLYTLKEEVRKNNSAYYDSVQSTIMSIDMLNEQKKAAIQNAFIMVAIGSVSPAVKLVKTLRGGVEITEKVAEDGSIIRKEIKKPYLDKKTGYITKTELTTIKTGEVLDKEVVKTTKVEKTVDAPQDYKRKTVYENTPTGTTRIKTKTIVERKVVNDLSNIEDNGVKIKTSTMYRNHETVPTDVTETVHTKVNTLDDGSTELAKTTIREEKTVFTSEQILETNKNKLAQKKSILEAYKKGELDLNPETVAKLERDIVTIESKIKCLLEKNELSRVTIKDKKVELNGTSTTEHTVASSFKSARYNFEGPSEELIGSKTVSVRTKLERLGIKGEALESLSKKIGTSAAKFSNFFEQASICKFMAADNQKFSAYANRIRMQLAASRFLSGGGLATTTYWNDHHNWGTLDGDIGSDLTSQAVKSYIVAGITTKNLLNKVGDEKLSLYQKSPSYEAYTKSIREEISDKKYRVAPRFWKTIKGTFGISVATKAFSGVMYYALGTAAEQYGEDDAVSISLARFGHAVVWIPVFSAGEVTMNNIIIGATCLIPGAKIFATVSNGTLKVINFSASATGQLAFPLVLNQFFYMNRGWTYDKLGFKKQKKISKTSEINEPQDNAKAEMITLDQYNNDYVGGKIDQSKTYVVEIQSPEDFN